MLIAVTIAILATALTVAGSAWSQWGRHHPEHELPVGRNEQEK